MPLVASVVITSEVWIVSVTGLTFASSKVKVELVVLCVLVCIYAVNFASILRIFPVSLFSLKFDSGVRATFPKLVMILAFVPVITYVVASIWLMPDVFVILTCCKLLTVTE